MSTRVVADDHTIINTQGIRFAEKVDSTWGADRTSFILRVTYKGDRMDYTYKDAGVRDAQFARLRAAMETPPAAAASDPHAGSTGKPPTRA